MRRAFVTTAMMIVVAFAAGWVASGQDDDTADAPRAVAYEPLPVPEMVIQHGPWADPPPEPIRAPAAPQLLDGFLGESQSAAAVVGLG